MVRLKCILSYDGTHFSGYQVQPEKRTVQGEIEKVLRKMHKDQQIKVIASGRTDSGVHAIGQTMHFDTTLEIPLVNWKRALNTMLPEDIVILDVNYVSSDFHARFNVKQKEYRYYVFQSKNMNVFKRNYVYQLDYDLDLEVMQQACTYFVGTHDFSSFCASNTSVVEKVRSIYLFEVDKTDNNYMFRIIGNGFLYQMVRIIVGTVLEIGKGKAEPETIITILNQQDRRAAYKTAPANGLYLWQVSY